MAQIDEIRKDREATLAKVKELSWDPFASKFDKKNTIAEALSMEGQEVQTAGRVVSSRTHGNITFMDLRDPTGTIQLFFQKEVAGEAYKYLRHIDLGDHIGVTGKVMKTTAGEISIQPASYELLTKAMMPLPSELKDVETRYRKRYLDLLVNEDVRDAFTTRSKVVSLFRRYMDDHGFMEVETPVLQPIYGGAYAKPFVTHCNALDSEFYLRIAVELYLKRLLVGGFEKVYEMGKNFRNEGFSRAHNPEFTMLEFYWAYADYEDLMKFSEEMIIHVVQEVNGSLTVESEGQTYDFTGPWERKTYRQLFIDHMQIDINDFPTEEALQKLVDEMKLLDEKVVGYGQMLDEMYKKHVRPHLKGPMFVTEYPLEIKALAKASKNDPTKSASFQLLINGMEMINAYNELNDPADQKARWEAEMKLMERGGEDYQVLDEDYIEALSYGMPPTAGWGMGIDRFVAFLTDQHTIKDVILFPTMRMEGKQENAQVVKPAVAVSSEKADLTITKAQAKEILEAHLTTKNLIGHCLAVGATMRAIATRLGGDEDLWELVGMLHDADWDETRETPDQHTSKTIEWIKDAGENNQQLIDAILSHNHHHNGFRQPESPLEWALYTCDELTGFIVAVALIRPEKKLAPVEVKSILKRFPVTGFAKPVDREQIKMCEEKLGIPLEEFVEITLKAMQGISEELGL